MTGQRQVPESGLPDLRASPGECPSASRRGRQGGFTLLEMTMTIAIAGIVAGMAVLFMQQPIMAYFDAARRAAAGDVADLALRRIVRELRRALPNSVRVGADGLSLEYIPTLAGGRYAEGTAAPCFVGGCTSVKTLGSLIAAAGQYVGASLVIFNYYNNAGGDCAAATLPSAYCGHNLATISATSAGAGQDTFAFAATRFYPAGGSPNARFSIVGGPVSFVCAPSAGGGVLTRHWGYARQAAQPASFVGAASAQLAGGVSACVFRYQAGVSQRHGLASLRLSIANAGETVTLYQDVHIDNAP